jgi:hypothetical protein
MRAPNLNNISLKSPGNKVKFKSNQTVNLQEDQEWRSVISEASLSDIGLRQESKNGLRRLKAGIVVIKYGRNGAPKNRVIRVDDKLHRLYWLDVKNFSGENFPSKSILFTEVIKIQSGVKYVKTSMGKECIPNCTGNLSKKCNLEQLKKCFSLILSYR